MKREIIYKGQCHQFGDWVCGNLIETLEGDLYICKLENIKEGGNTPNYFFTKVIPDTVGQFTGLQDKNGVDIYQWDEVVFHIGEEEQKGYIDYCQDYASFVIFYNDGIDRYKQINAESVDGETYQCDWIEVINNIHDKQK